VSPPWGSAPNAVAAIPPPTLAEPVVYQVRVWLRGVSPMIWRRLLVRGDSTLADLHETLQLALGWTDTHLHRFRIHGREFAVPRDGDALLDDARQARLSQFGFRLRERFLYEYDFTDAWQHELRIEAVRPIEARRSYPACLAGKRAGPPEECGGPWAYLELRDGLRRRALASMVALAEDILAGPGDEARGRSRRSLATADDEVLAEMLAEDDDADDPWSIRSELERLWPQRAVLWTPRPSHEVRPPDLPGGYDPVQVAATMLARRRLPFDPERFDRRRLNARLARLARGDRDGLFEVD
jgi:hypothetical protein